MADIELVIKISEEDYKIMKHNIAINNPLCPLSQEEMVSKVANGTPLPKGHGRLIDADEMQFENSEFDTYSDYCIAFDAIDQADTIIEADKEYEVEVITRGNCMMCGKELVEVDGLFFCKECENKVNGRK